MREGRRERGTGGYGWLATVGGAALLLVLGFGVGLLAGSFFEEPDLVAKQLSGETTELALPEPPPEAEAAAAPPAAPSAAGAPPGVSGATPGAAGDEGAGDFDAGDERSAPAAAPRPAPGASPPPPAPKAPVAAPAEPAGGPPAVAAPKEPPAPPAPVAAPGREATPPVSARGPGFAVQVGAFADRGAADQLVGSLRGDRFPAYLVEGAPGEGARFRVRVGPYATREQASGQAARLKERRRLPTWVIREGGP